MAPFSNTNRAADSEKVKDDVLSSMDLAQKIDKQVSKSAEQLEAKILR